MSKKFACRFPRARIKALIQEDEDVGNVAAESTFVISRAIEFFLDEIVTALADRSAGAGVDFISTSHVRAVVEANPLFDFLKKTVAAAPPLDEAKDAQAMERAAVRARVKARREKPGAGAKAKAKRMKGDGDSDGDGDGDDDDESRSCTSDAKKPKLLGADAPPPPSLAPPIMLAPIAVPLAAPPPPAAPAAHIPSYEAVVNAGGDDSDSEEFD